jgi:hypothetical protein
MWETGFWETLVDILQDATHLRDQAAGGPLLDTMTDWWDERLEALASIPGTAEWDEMKKNAEDVSIGPNGGLFLLAQLLASLNLPKLKLHLIGNSAGAILHSYLVPLLLEENLRIDGIYFMAPACRAALFNANVRGSLGNQVATYTEFYLNDAMERADNCAMIYRHSLLYLVSYVGHECGGALAWRSGHSLRLTKVVYSAHAVDRSRNSFHTRLDLQR